MQNDPKKQARPRLHTRTFAQPHLDQRATLAHPIIAARFATPRLLSGSHSVSCSARARHASHEPFHLLTRTPTHSPSHIPSYPQSAVVHLAETRRATRLTHPAAPMPSHAAPLCHPTAPSLEPSIDPHSPSSSVLEPELLSTASTATSSSSSPPPSHQRATPPPRSQRAKPPDSRGRPREGLCGATACGS